MIAPSPPYPVAIAAQPDRIKRQDFIVLTQTIVTPDSTRTAVITLGNGGHPDAGPVATSAPNDPPHPPSSGAASTDSSSSSSSGSLSPAQIGIILCCCLGAVLLFVVLWFWLSHMRRLREAQIADNMRSFVNSYYYISEDGGLDDDDDGPDDPDPARPRRSAWPTWRSIPPPVVPTYTARDPGRQWRASQRVSTTMWQ
ncbi:hypothetical protein PG994_004933 [Apiospora phragmitis]|uniref:Uncharacterized protein n=1 Tax=Apiospora phragmitis TaxID=2905665 RepID=A0ABR1VS00_9PEZI